MAPRSAPAETKRRVAMLVAGALDAPTGGSRYNRRMAEALVAAGWAVDVHELHGAFPHPDERAITAAAQVLASLPDGCATLVDGLAFSALPDVARHEASRLRLVALVHLPLAADVTFDKATRERLRPGERMALQAAALVVVTGEATRPLLGVHGIAENRITVVAPGTDRASLARGSGGPGVHLLSVATLSPGKGHDVLLRALALLPVELDWHLTCAGSLTRWPETAGRVRALVDELGFSQRVTLAGTLEGQHLDEAYDRADVFVLATHQETYGMATAEALARGLPVITTNTGAATTLLAPDTDHAAGVVVAPGDVSTIGQALTHVLGSAAYRAALAEGARRARQHLRTWDEAAWQLAAALENLRR